MKHTHSHTHRCVWRESASTFCHNKRGPINKGGYTSVIKCQNDYCVSERLAYSNWTRRVELSSQSTSMNKRIQSYYKLTSQHVKPFAHIQRFWTFAHRIHSPCTSMSVRWFCVYFRNTAGVFTFKKIMSENSVITHPRCSKPVWFSIFLSFFCETQKKIFSRKSTLLFCGQFKHKL